MQIYGRHKPELHRCEHTLAFEGCRGRTCLQQELRPPINKLTEDDTLPLCKDLQWPSVLTQPAKVCRLSKAHVILGTQIISNISSCAYFCNACCGLHSEFQMLFFLFLILFPSALSSLAAPANSTLCLRPDMSQSVILKQKKTFTRYKILASSCAPSTSKCQRTDSLKKPGSFGHPSSRDALEYTNFWFPAIFWEFPCLHVEIFNGQLGTVI